MSAHDDSGTGRYEVARKCVFGFVLTDHNFIDIAQFSQNLLDATDDFALYFEDKEALKGIPDDLIAMFAAAAGEKGGYKVGLQMPHYLAIMQYADNRELREQVYKAYVTRASE